MDNGIRVHPRRDDAVVSELHDPWLIPPGSPAAAETTSGPIKQWREWWAQQADSCRDDVAAELAATQGFVVATDQLLSLGLTHADVRRAIRRRTWSRPARGTASPVVVPPDDEYFTRRRRHALRSSAAALVRPDHAVSGRSGATLHGLPTMALPDIPILTGFDDETLGRRQGAAHVRGATLHLGAVTTWFGAPVTTPARTLVDLARLNRRDGIMAADAALHEGLVTVFAIEAELARAAGWPGVRQAREVLALADPLAESPLESITRLALHDDNFPPPRLQRWIGRDRVDLYWPAYRFVLEADGRGKYTGDENAEENFWEEKKREQRLRAHLKEVRYVERVIWSDITQNWPATSARLRSYFRR